MNESILILDDETSILDILGQHLTAEGYQCKVTTSPVHALDKLKTGGFSLLITDLKMPEMNGIEVVRRASGLDSALAIIVVTALIDVTSAIDAMRAGADDYLLKPFNLNEITVSVAKTLEKRALVIENRQYQHQLEARVREATESLEAMNKELRQARDYLENLLHSTIDAILTASPGGKVDFVNEGALELLGCPRPEVMGAPISRFLIGGVDEERHITRLLEDCRALKSYETELRGGDGQFIPVNMSISRVLDMDGNPNSKLMICKDITEQKRLERELKEMSIKDSLTGLYNQRYFYDRLDAEIERARRQKHPLSLVLFDIDQFKVYNDCHGHLEGDKVLAEAGSVVVECTREHVDTGFRYGGDEFTVILPEADEAQARNIAERIRATFEAKKFDKLTLSIGLMTYREGYSLRTFIQFADAMMYDAKRSGGNQVYVHKPEVAWQTEGDDA